MDKREQELRQKVADLKAKAEGLITAVNMKMQRQKLRKQKREK